METTYSSPATPQLLKVSRYLNLFVFLSPVFVIIGWVIGNEILKSWMPDAASMNPLSAVCFLACAYALWLQPEENIPGRKLRNAKLIAFTVGMIGLGKTITTILGLDFYLDTILFHGHSWDPFRNELNKMSPNAAICFLLTGFSLFWFDKETKSGRRPAQYFSILIMFIAILSLYGYVYGVRFLYGITKYKPMSIISAVNFLVLSVSMLFARPEKGTMAVIIGDTSAEVTLLRLAAFIIPLVMGWLKLKGERLGYYNTEFGTALFAIVTYMLAMFLLARRSVVNYKLRLARREVQDELKRSHDRFMKFFNVSPSAKLITTVDDGRILYTNKVFDALFSPQTASIEGKRISELEMIDVAERERLVKTVKEAKPFRGLEVRMQSASGETKDMLCNSEVLDIDGEKCMLSNYTDITLRKKLEDALRENEERLRLIINTSLDAFVSMDDDGIITDWNRQAETTFGWKREEAIGKNLSDTIIPEHYREAHRKGLSHFLTTGKGPVLNSRIELEGLHKNGTIFPIELTITAILQKEEVFFCAFAHDITERRRKEEEIKRANTFLNTILENIPNMIFVKDAKELRFVRFNKAGEELLGYSRADLIGKNDYDFFPKDQADFFTSKDREVLRQKDVVDIAEEPIETKNGTRYLHTKKITIRDQQQNPIYLMGISEDVTDRKRATEALLQSEQLLRSIVDNIGIGLVVMNAEGKYLVINDEAQQIIQQRLSHANVDSLPETFGLFYADKTTRVPRDQTTIARSFRGLKTDNQEYFIRNEYLPEGKFIVSTGRPLFDKDQNVIAAVSVFRDNTQTRHLQDLLEESEAKLQTVMRRIGEGVVMCNSEGKFILFNRKAEEILGKAAQDIPPEQWPEAYQIYQPDGKRLFKVDELLLMRALKGEKIDHAEAIIRPSGNGTEKHLFISAYPVKDHSGNILAAVASFRDVSELKHLEALLQDVRRKYGRLATGGKN